MNTANPAEKKLRVLIVDDDPGALSVLDAILSEEFEVVTCLSSREALKILKTQSFQVVCTDFQMPHMNGLVLLQQIEQFPEYTAGLLITGSTDVKSHKDWSDERRVVVVFKPYDPDKLLRVVRQFAQIANMRRRVDRLKK
jgi:DNA-binding NtrC family response regulator